MKGGFKNRGEKSHSNDSLQDYAIITDQKFLLLQVLWSIRCHDE
jgi:hypothetical protein